MFPIVCLSSSIRDNREGASCVKWQNDTGGKDRVSGTLHQLRAEKFKDKALCRRIETPAKALA